MQEDFEGRMYWRVGWRAFSRWIGLRFLQAGSPQRQDRELFSRLKGRGL